MQLSILALLLVSMVAANLPFATRRLFGIVPLLRKHIGWQLLELLVLYAVVGGFAYLLESRSAPVHSQNWQFYVTTLSLFVVFAFPGFVARYFWRQRGQ